METIGVVSFNRAVELFSRERKTEKENEMPTVGFEPMPLADVPVKYREAALKVADMMRPPGDGFFPPSREEIAENLLGLMTMISLDSVGFGLHTIGISVPGFNYPLEPEPEK